MNPIENTEVQSESAMDSVLSGAYSATSDVAIRLKRLKTEHLLARQRLNDAHDPFIHRVPLNIVTKILLMDEQNHSTKTDTARPLLLASVSRSWRSVIFSIHQLWATMRMYRNCLCWNLPQYLAEEWLARSEALPLRISLHWATPLDHNPALPLHSIGKLIVLIQKQSHRLETLQLDVPTDVLHTLQLDPINPTPLLRSYTLAVGEVDVRWTNINYDVLTEVHIKDGLDTLETLEFFRLCPNLKRCDLCVQHLYEPILPASLPTEPIVLPNLKYLKLDLIMHTPEHIPLWISTPKLRQFHLCMSQTLFDASPWAAMMERSGCPLRSFMYENQWMKSNEDISTLLQQMPTLQALRLKVNNVYSTGPHTMYEPVFRRLISSASSNKTEFGPERFAFLPDLRKLIYEGPIPFSWPQYADFCEAHAQQHLNPSIHLVVIHLIWWDAIIDKETRSRLLALPQATREIIRLGPKECWGEPPASIE